MKKLLATLLAVLLVLTAVPAFATTWDNPDVTSPYSVTVIPVKLDVNLFGQTSYTQDFGAAKAGDTVSFAVRVEIPDKPQAATLTIKANNAVLNSATTATLPLSAGVYYLTADGAMQKDFCILSAYCTGIPTVNAYVKGSATVSSAGSLAINTDSNGFVFSDAGRGMSFYADAAGKVYSSYVFGLDFRYKLTSEILAADSEAGSIARYVIKTLDMDGNALLAGNIYMSKNILAKNFGVLVNTETSKTWGDAPQTMPSTITLPVSPIAEIPATGAESNLIVISGVLLILGIAWLIYEMVRDIKKEIKKEGERCD